MNEYRDPPESYNVRVRPGGPYRDTRSPWRAVRDQWKYAKREPMKMPWRAALTCFWPVMVCLVVGVVLAVISPDTAEPGDAVATAEAAIAADGLAWSTWAGVWTLLAMVPTGAYGLVRMYLWTARRRWQAVREPACPWCAREGAAHDAYATLAAEWESDARGLPAGTNVTVLNGCATKLRDVMAEVGRAERERLEAIERGKKS